MREPPFAFRPFGPFAGLHRSRWVSNPPMRSFWRLVEREGQAQPLRGFSVVGVQHLLASTGGLLHGLAWSGASDLLISGKAYSANWRVVAGLRADGIDVRYGDRFMHDEHRLERPGVKLERIVAAIDADPDPKRRYLIIDDGGELIQRIHDLLGRRPDLRGRIVAVEQTMRGRRELAKLALRLPVIDVGGAYSKGIYESPMIGRSIGQAVQRKLAKVRLHGIPLPREAVLLGYGNVGRAAARYLSAQGFRVATYDRVLDEDPDSPRAQEIRAQARRDGVRLLSRREALARAHILIEASGEPDLTSTDLEQLPDGAMLINAASGIATFGATADMRRDPDRWRRADLAEMTLFRGRPLTMRRFQGQRRDVVLRTRSGKQLLLADDGFVINFAPRLLSPTPRAAAGLDPIPPRYIQFTRGLLYLAALQAVRTTESGLHPLARRAQADWAAEVERELARSGESLLDPTF
jgi:S-adenosylhomocysteine hydrolase